MRILEVSDREEAAAYCGKLFARWGARVDRVEPAARARDLSAAAQAAALYLHAGKALHTFDLSTEAGRERLREMAADVDAVICDLPVDVIEACLPDLAPAPVRTLITPYGRTGPYRDAPATAVTLLALGGHTFLSGDPGRVPLTMPGRYAYYQAGSYSYVATLSTILGEASDRTIDVSVFEVLASLHQFTDVMWTFGRQVRSRHGNRWENLCPTTMLPCADGWVTMNILPNFWEPFALWIGGPDLVDDPRFATNEARMRHQDEMDQVILRIFRDRTMQEVFREGQETWRVPVGYLQSLAGVMDDPHLAAREFWRSVSGPGSRTVRTAGSPFRFTGVSLPAERPPGETLDAPRHRPRPVLHTPHPTRPLEGVRIVDLTRIWSGPLATRILGDLGAEVIKVEAPTGRGPRQVPATRGGMWPPGGPGGRPWNRQGLVNKLNRNKRSICVDLKQAEGHDLFLRLVAESHVVVENFSARAMSGLGLGYEDLRRVNPSVIYLSMPAFGSFGPYRDYIGLGPSIEPLSGLTALMGYGPDEPRVTSMAITDASAGVTASAAILTALWRRNETGEGAMIDLSQAEAMTAYLGEHFIEMQLTGREPERIGNAHPQVSPHGVYPCAGDDRWIALAARDETEWRALASCAGCGWEADPRFATPEARLEHRAALDTAIAAWTATQDAWTLMEMLLTAGAPAGAVTSAPDMQSDPHLEARGYFATVDSLDTGPYRTDGSPLLFDGMRGYEAWTGPCALGEANVEVLAGLGYSDEEIQRLHAQGVVADAPPV